MPFYHQLALRDKASTIDLIANVWYDGTKHPVIIGRMPYNGESIGFNCSVDWGGQPQTAAGRGAVGDAIIRNQNRQYAAQLNQEMRAMKARAESDQKRFNTEMYKYKNSLEAELSAIGGAIDGGAQAGSAGLGTGYAAAAALAGGVTKGAWEYVKTRVGQTVDQVIMPKVQEALAEAGQGFIGEKLAGLSIDSQDHVIDLSQFYNQYAGSSMNIDIPELEFIFLNEGNPTSHVASVIQMLRYVMPSTGKASWADGEVEGGFVAGERPPNNFQQPPLGKDYSKIKGDFDLRIGRAMIKHLIPTNVKVTRSADCSIVKELDEKYIPSMALPFSSELLYDIIKGDPHRSIELPTTYGASTFNASDFNKSREEGGWLYIPNTIKISIAMKHAIAYLPEDALTTIFGGPKQ